MSTLLRTKAPKAKTLRRLWGYMWAHKLLILSAAALTLGSNLLALWAPKLSGYAIDAITPGEGRVDFGTVFYYAGLMIACYLISAVMTYGLSVLMIRLSQKIVYAMRRDVFEKLCRLPVGYFDRYQAGDIISRISYDIDTVNASLSTDLMSLLTSLITVIGAFINMILIAPLLFSVFVFTIPLSLLFTYVKSKKLHPLFRLRSSYLGALNGYTEETISGQRSAKAYCAESIFISRFQKHNADASKACYDADYYSSVVGPSVNLINNISVSLISAVGAVMYLFGMLSLGNISSFILYSRKFAGPISEVATIFNELQSAMAAAERVFYLLDEPEELPDAAHALTLTDVRGEVEFRNIRFGYNPDKVIIHRLNFLAGAGKLVAIVGPTGAGKTTIINLLMRFYDADAGEIFIDGHEIRSLTRDSLRRAFTMVLQDTWLFEGTIRENIAYGHEDAGEGEVERVAAVAGVDKYIETLPDGYDTMLSDNGINISKGQKQLLTIARAMLSDAKMLILDEATSNVDTRTEKHIQAAMRRLMEGRTCFIIAHRLSTIQNADHILVVRDGDIVEQGTHTQLLEKNGFYATMYNSQFE